VRSDSDAWEEYDQAEGGNESGAPSAESTHHRATQRRAHEATDVGGRQDESYLVQAERQPVTDLGQSGQPTAEEDSVDEEQRRHPAKGSAMFHQGRPRPAGSAGPAPPFGQPAPAQALPLVGGQATPDAVALIRLEGIKETVVANLAPAADLLCLADLDLRGTGFPGREEQVGGVVATLGALAPVGTDFEFEQSGFHDTASTLRTISVKFNRYAGISHAPRGGRATGCALHDRLPVRATRATGGPQGAWDLEGRAERPRVVPTRRR